MRKLCKLDEICAVVKSVNDITRLPDYAHKFNIVKIKESIERVSSMIRGGEFSSMSLLLPIAL